jgi:hypothetical protein
MKELAYVFPFFFVGMFILVLFILSRRGWIDLASHFGYSDYFSGDRIGLTSASINGVNYNNCLLVKVNEQGIYFKPVFVFRLFHKPILVPWSEIKSIRDKKVLFINLKELVIGEPAIALLQMKPLTVEKLEQFRGGRIVR